MAFLDTYAGCLNLKRKRNHGEASLASPDLCVLVRNALLFKGEDRFREDELEQAVGELKHKMRGWGQNYQGQVKLFRCICSPLLMPY